MVRRRCILLVPSEAESVHTQLCWVSCTPGFMSYMKQVALLRSRGTERRPLLQSLKGGGRLQSRV